MERNTEEVYHELERCPSGKSVKVLSNGSNDVTDTRNVETNGINGKIIGINEQERRKQRE